MWLLTLCSILTLVMVNGEPADTQDPTFDDYSIDEMAGNCTSLDCCLTACDKGKILFCILIFLKK